MPPHGLKKEMKLPDAAERASQSEQPNGHPGAGAGARFALLIVVVVVAVCWLCYRCCWWRAWGSQQVTKKFVAEAATKTKKAKYLH